MNDSNSIDDNQCKATDSYPPRWFGFKGRITRSRWWAVYAFYIGVFVCFMVVVGFNLWHTESISGDAAFEVMDGIAAALNVFASILFLGINAQRLHDIGSGYSGWWQLLIGVFLSILSTASYVLLDLERGLILGIMLGFLGLIIFLGIFGCIPGNPEKNKYGDPPPRKR